MNCIEVDRWDLAGPKYGNLTVTRAPKAGALEERIQLLSLVDIFESLSDEEIQQLNGRLSDVHLEPNEIFYTPQDRSKKQFVLWKWRVRIYKTTDGREFTLATMYAGTVFGEMALTAQQMQEAYAQAMRPSELFAYRNKPKTLHMVACQRFARRNSPANRYRCRILSSKERPSRSIRGGTRFRLVRAG